MLALFLLMTSLLYSMAVQPTNAIVNQKIAYNGAMICYYQHITAYWVASLDQTFNQTAQCDFPALIQRNSTDYNFNFHYFDEQKHWTYLPLVIEFNETIARFSSEESLRYVVSGDGMVRSQLFNGYRAKQLIRNLYDYVPDERDVFYGEDTRSGPTVCDQNGGYTQRMEATMYLVVYPQSLSEQSVNEIHSKLTYDSTVTPPIKDQRAFFETTLNSTGVTCFGNAYTRFTTTISN